MKIISRNLIIGLCYLVPIYVLSLNLAAGDIYMLLLSWVAILIHFLSTFFKSKGNRWKIVVSMLIIIIIMYSSITLTNLYKEMTFDKEAVTQ